MKIVCVPASLHSWYGLIWVSSMYLCGSLSYLLCCSSVFENCSCSSFWGDLLQPSTCCHAFRPAEVLYFAPEAEDREVCDSTWLLWNSLFGLWWDLGKCPAFHRQLYFYFATKFYHLKSITLVFTWCLRRCLTYSLMCGLSDGMTWNLMLTFARS